MRRLPVLRPFLIAALLLLFTRTAHAQYTIQGTVTDTRKMPVSYASVAWLHLPDSVLVATEMTNDSGHYKMNGASVGDGLLKVLVPGYLPQYKVIAIPSSPVVVMDFTLTAASKTLTGITVSAQKPLIERKVDRTVFNVESSVVSIGADAFEAMKKAPGVRIVNNDIGIAGKSTVSVMINDRLLQVSGDDLVAMLKTIPADQVARIEVITTPPARYDAAGNSGIINIVLKKSLKNGLNGNLMANYTQRTRGGGGMNGSFNYRQGKINIYGNGNAYRSYIIPVENISTQYPGQQQDQRNTREELSVFNRINIGADYSLNNRSVIGIVYTLGSGGPEWNGHEFITSKVYQLPGHALDSLLQTTATAQDRGLRNVLNLNYEWKIDTSGKKLNIDFDYFSRIGSKARDFTTTHFLPNDVPTGFSVTNRTSGTQVVEIKNAKVDIAWPTAFAVFSYGAKASFIHNTSDNNFEFLQVDHYINDSSKTNQFDYLENTQAVYFSAQKSLNKWEAQVGLRAEYTQTTGYSPTINQTTRNDYFKLFPTAYIQYRFNEDHVVNINYSKRIDRPTFWTMNPFRSYSTSTSYEEGNPFLQPSFSNNVELGYTFKSKYSFTLFTQRIAQFQTRISRIDSATNSFYFSQANAGSVVNYGFSANGTFKPFKWMESNVQVFGSYNSFTSSYYGDAIHYSRGSYAVNLNNDITLNKSKTLLAAISYSYYSPQQSDFDIQQAASAFETGIKALLLKKQLVIGINAEDIFRTHKFQVSNLYNGTVQDSYYDDQGLRFSVNWKFGNTNVKAKRERIGGNEEQNR